MSSKNSISSYKAPNLLFNGHIQTIYPALFRPIGKFKVEQEIVKTQDSDILFVDRWKQGAKKAVVISHGLEGNSTRPYVLGMAWNFYNSGYDILAWNYRSCGPQMNKQPILYHSGATYDLKTVIDQYSEEYDEMVLVGFSLGGNMTLKFAGEQGMYKNISKVIAFSVPLDLKSGSLQLTKGLNKIYERRFLKSLKRKLSIKAQQFPELIDLQELRNIRTLYEFDEKMTAPIHGFHGAEDYYQRCSSRFFLSTIETPTLIVNAMNDPLLTPQTLNKDLGAQNAHITYEITRHGGHCGYGYLFGKRPYWSEQRAILFAK